MRISIPPAVLALCTALRERGHEAVLVGGCIRDALIARPVRDWDIATSAPVGDVLACFRRAVAMGASARHGTALVPTAAGPVDITTFRGPDLASDLARRDFTVNALAFDVVSGELIDPHGGERDLAELRLRAVGRAADRFAEDPLRALRAARLLAELGLVPDAEIEAAMHASAPALLGLAAERVRTEFLRALLGPHATAAFVLLRHSGIEATFAPGTRDDAAAVIGALPAELALRLAGWLRGAARTRVLARLRVGRPLARRVNRVLALHPLDAHWDGSEAGVRKVRRRAGDEDTLAQLLLLREAECIADGNGWATGRIAALRGGLEASPSSVFGPGDLALRGDDVMAALGAGPGPHVGRALRHLVDCVVAEPGANTPERLRELLATWSPTRNP